MTKEQIVKKIYQVRKKMVTNLPGNYSRRDAIDDLNQLEKEVADN